MPNETVEHIIKSCYIVKVQMATIKIIPIFVQKREIFASALYSFQDCATIGLLMNKLKWFASLHKRRMLPAILAKGWLKSIRLPLLFLATDALRDKKHHWLLEDKTTWQV